jgi:HD-GYP domain-containing protein (c-di-GMP phosphodiesterase class II)
MRYVSINNIQEGMVLAKRLVGKNDELLLNQGAVLIESYINKIKALGYTGIYIEDSLSDEITVQETIDEKLHASAVKTIKQSFFNIYNGTKLSLAQLDDISNIVKDIVDSILSNKDAMVNMIDLKVFDDYTFYHCVNVGVLSLVIGSSLDFNKDQLCALGLSSILHDIGKMFVSPGILNKDSLLTHSEFEIMKAHSYLGYKYLRENFEIPISSYIGVLQHHEKYNGDGYPDRIAGKKISVFGRIISIVDVFDALTSNRPYRDAISPSEAMEYVMGSGGVLFDPEIVEVFCKKIAPYPVGTTVLLSDNRTGLVVENYADCSTRPKIKIYKHGDIEITPYIIDLKNDKNTMGITIKNIT